MTDRPDPPDADAVFSSISAQARETNRIRVDTLERLIRGATDGALPPADRRLAKDLSHQIAGSAGTFGFDNASNLARQIEELLAHEFEADTMVRLLDRVVELRAEFE